MYGCVNAGVAIPVAVLALIGLLGLILALLFFIRRNGNRYDDWEISYDELEIGEALGTGGYGEVYKATWKGTEVAVKVMASEKATKEMEKGFKDEVDLFPKLSLSLALIHTHQLLHQHSHSSGEGNDGAETSECGSVYGSFNQGSQDVHRYGVHGPRFSLRRTSPPIIITCPKEYTLIL